MKALSQAKQHSIAIVVACVGTAVASIFSSKPLSSSQAEKKRKEKLEVNLMDKIANKPYLNYHSARSAYQYQQQTKRYNRGRHNNDAESSKNNTSENHSSQLENRPKGVPSRLRVLTVDVPEFKQQAFDHSIRCEVPSAIFHSDNTKPLKYADGIAPPKSMNKTLGHNERQRSSKEPIVQKSLAKQLYYCYDSSQYNPHHGEDQPVIGVEVLEASVKDLNPNNIRRTYTSSRWKKTSYDRGKYTDTGIYDDDSGVADADEAEVEEETLEQNTEHILATDERRQSNDNEFEEKDIDDPDYERFAPWNQYAWLDEVHLRINGLVPFGGPMQRAHYLSQIVYGRIYRQSVPTAPSRGGWLSWIWWPFHSSNLDGVDGEGENVLYGSDTGNSKGIISNVLHPWKSSSKVVLNRASNKPHAVICDGQAMQRVPGSLRYLSKICREAGIPLYILNDPRSWGSQTHSTLSDAIVDMRKVVSENVIRNALDLREGSAFERGRMVGQLETEMAWQARDAARKTRESLKDARRSLKGRSTKVEDWSTLSEDDLLKKLAERNVIKLYIGEEDRSTKGVESFSDSLLALCKNCLERDSEKQQPKDSDS